MTQPDFRLTVYYSANSDILASIVGPEWFYTVQCPGVAASLRSPKFGVEGLLSFLSFAMAPYREGAGDHVRLPTVPSSHPFGTPACVANEFKVTNTSVKGTATVEAYVYHADAVGQGCYGLPTVVPPSPVDPYAPLGM